MIKRSSWAILIVTLFVACQQGSEKKFIPKTGEENGYSYTYVTNDPLNARIYTLKNGLKVYLSRYEDKPRIHTNIAIRAGGKNDPANATGLAHYLEHLLFKGTSEFGTTNWEKESEYIAKIEKAYEEYRLMEDEQERKAQYAKIDSLSSIAASYAIANEYDKMLSMIGATGTNAYTWYDMTVYVNNIPSNEMERWMKIESERFSQFVPRLFHTELEAVYEEKNNSLDSDSQKSFRSLMRSLFPEHPYGTQSVIGTIDHLKNPSITAIREYFAKYYVPENMAICMSGDLDYAETIKMIDDHFGKWENNEKLEKEEFTASEIGGPVVKEVWGPDAENVRIGFRFPGANSRESILLKLSDMILSGPTEEHMIGIVIHNSRAGSRRKDFLFLGKV
jgi:predicted Zn-dependent peptidase